MKWNASMKIGDKVIDEQHKNLMGYLDALSKRISSKAGIDLGDIRSAIDTLVNYTREHFRYEENYMKAKKMPGITAHKKVHDKFIETLSEFMARFEKMGRQKSFSSVKLKKLLEKLAADLQEEYLADMLYAKKHHKKE